MADRLAAEVQVMLCCERARSFDYATIAAWLEWQTRGSRCGEEVDGLATLLHASFGAS